MTPFTCPRCGGHYFGTPEPIKNPNVVECHNTEDGEHYSLDLESFARGIRPGKPCGWRGDRKEAGIES